MEPTPAHSKAGLLLDKAEHISDNGSIHGIKIMKGKKLLCKSKLQLERRVRIWVRNSPAYTTVSEEGGERVLQVPEQRFLLQPMVRTLVRQRCPCSLGSSTAAQRSACSLWRTPYCSRWMPEGGCDPMGGPQWIRFLSGPVERGAHAGAGLLPGLVIPQRTHGGGLKDYTLWKGTHAAAVNEELQPMGRTHTGEVFMEECLPWETSHVREGEEYEEFFPYRGRNGTDNM
ncbi:hypothetical protein WISP_87613 [Willisornis vidua]|uniref:Uncharacterized protein n=1 Tax=Willisornis vidua TaxID=1566151 RepID=A0ABQ9D2L6_9PASS|nr:hypothetical protein WISP_87613 [Willisornis vidua]